jgi:hypothetical protein
LMPNPDDQKLIERLSRVLAENQRGKRGKVLRDAVDAHLCFWEAGAAQEKNPSAVALGELGGKAGKGRKGLAAMPAKKRREIQEKAWAARRAQKKDSST